MNIHFKDKLLFHQLLQATLVQVEVGSCMYGLKDAASDTDMLCIYVPTLQQQYSFVRTHHQLQYKEETTCTDYLFCDIFTFLHNVLNGDATINFEALHSPTLENSCLAYLYQHRAEFYGYQVIKAYLGFANRDIKLFGKEKGFRNQTKKLLHIVRSYLFAIEVFENRFSLTIESLEVGEWEKETAINVVKNPNLSSLEKLQILRKQLSLYADNTREFATFCSAFLVEMQALIKYFRQEVVNKAIDSQSLNRFMSVENQKNLDKWLFDLCSSDFFQQKQFPLFEMELYYKVMGGEVMYE